LGGITPTTILPLGFINRPGAQGLGHFWICVSSSPKKGVDFSLPTPLLEFFSFFPCNSPLTDAPCPPLDDYLLSNSSTTHSTTGPPLLVFLRSNFPLKRGAFCFPCRVSQRSSCGPQSSTLFPKGYDGDFSCPAPTNIIPQTRPGLFRFFCFFFFSFLPSRTKPLSVLTKEILRPVAQTTAFFSVSIFSQPFDCSTTKHSFLFRGWRKASFAWMVPPSPRLFLSPPGTSISFFKHLGKRLFPPGIGYFFPQSLIHQGRPRFESRGPPPNTSQK